MFDLCSNNRMKPWNYHIHGKKIEEMKKWACQKGRCKKSAEKLILRIKNHRYAKWRISGCREHEKKYKPKTLRCRKIWESDTVKNKKKCAFMIFNHKLNDLINIEEKVYTRKFRAMPLSQMFDLCSNNRMKPWNYHIHGCKREKIKKWACQKGRWK